MSPSRVLDDDGRLRPRMGKRPNARDRMAAGSVSVARLVRHGHGRRGPGRARSARVPTAAPGFAPRRNARRVVIKAHVQYLSRHGAQAASRHLRYIERDGVEKDGSPGVLYGPDGLVERQAFEEPRLRERHQFRFIISPEDGSDLDLTAFTRNLMNRVERDLGQRLEWAAVNHHDSDHPHVHVVVRGVDRDGGRVFMQPAYIARGMRWSAQELATDWLGPRLESEIQKTYESEVARERLTSLDRELASRAQGLEVDATAFEARRGFPEPETLVRRLEQLERLGLAERGAGSRWALSDGWQDELRELGLRGDRLKQIHRAMTGVAPAHFHVITPGQGIPDGAGGIMEGPLVGRLLRKGLADENKGNYYGVLETPAGAVYHVPLTARAVDGLEPGALVMFSATRREPDAGPVDRNVAREDASGDRKPPRYRHSVAPMELPLADQVVRRRPVWLDQVDPATLSPRGLGAEVNKAIEQRRQVLGALGVSPGDPELGGKLREVERRAVGSELARQTGEAFLAETPDRFRGLAVWASDVHLAICDERRRFVLVEASAEARALKGHEVAVHRAQGGRLILVDEGARLELGTKIARETGAVFVSELAEGFHGVLRQGPKGTPFLVVGDWVRFGLVPDTPEARAMVGQRVDVTRGFGLALSPERKRDRGLER
jgi:type IV secretory pathway VirD2 relaxase